MKTLITLATLAFWAIVGTTHLLAAGTDQPPSGSAEPATSAAVAGKPPAPVDNSYPLTEVARHADAASCWMVIEGIVYDFTGYLPRHPSAPSVMLRHCGQEASEAFRTKDAGRPHSDYARQLLDEYRIGTLRP